MRKTSAIARLTFVLFATLFAPLASVRSVNAAQVTLAWSANTEPDIAGYKIWYSSGGAYASINVGNVTTAVVPNLAAGTKYTFYATAYNTSGLESGPSTTVTYTVPATGGSAPVITTQPESKSVTAGTLVTFTVQVADTTSVQYQWYFNSSPISGATSASYSLTAETSNAGGYSVRVSNPYGSVSSSSATLTVQAVTVQTKPVFITQPESQTIPAGTTLSLSAEATGTDPIYYQWYFNGVPIPGATSSTFQIASAKTTDSGAYLVRAQNGIGFTFSSNVQVTVTSVTTVAPPVITVQPPSQNRTVGQSLNLAAQATGSAPLTYQWFRDGTPISGATSSAIQIASVQLSDAGSYVMKVSNAGGSVFSNPALISIEPAPIDPPSIVSNPISQTVRAGDLVSLSVQATGTSLQYQWSKDGTPIPNAVSYTFQCPAAQAADAGVYRVAVSNSGGTVTSAAATVEVLLPPAITKQPVSQTVTAGGNLTLSVAASGSAPLTYRWYRNDVAIPGGTEASLTISPVQSQDAGSFKVAVSNSAGTSTSDPAVIQVIVPPTIARNPASQTLNLGGSLALTVDATGSAPLQYQWNKNGAAVPGATASTYSVASVSAEDTAVYTVRVTNAAGSVTSAEATVTVLSPPVFTIQPINQKLSQGARLSISVQATGAGPLTYRWFHNGTEISGAGSSLYQVESAEESDSGTYFVRVSNSAGTVTSSPAEITVTAPPVITTQPSSQTVAVGAPLQLSVAAKGSAPLVYQWFRNGVTIPNAGTASLQLSSVSSVDEGYYTVRISNSAGAVTSVSANVTVLIPPAIVQQPDSQTVAPGAPATFSVQSTGSTPLRYQWYRNNVAIQNATGATLAIAAVQAADTGSYTVEVSNDAGKILSSAAVLAVIGAPQINTQPQSQTVAAGTSMTLSVAATGPGTLKYQWFRDGSLISGATLPQLQIPSIQEIQAGLYTVNVSNAGGTVTGGPAEIKVVIPPVIIQQPLGRSVNVGESLSLTVQATGSQPFEYQWYRNGTPISGAQSAAYQIIAVGTSDEADYTVKVSNLAGSTLSTPATVKVVPPPVITAQPQSQTVIAGSSFTLSVQASGSGPLQYQWSHNDDVLPGATGATLRVDAVQPGDAGNYTVRVSNAAGSITSSAATISVLSAPSITQQPISKMVASGSPLTLSAQAIGSAPLKYQWYRNGAKLDGATSSSLTIPAVDQTFVGSYTVTVSNDAGSVTSAPATVTLTTAPVINVQPLSQSIAAGGALTLSVEAGGTAPLQYRWSKNGVTIPNATDSQLSVTPVSSADAGAYTVTVSNSAGTVTSAPAEISIITAPAITLQPLSQSVIQGESLALKVQATGTGPLQYQWFKNSAPIQGASSETFLISSAGVDDNAEFSVKVSNLAGSVVSTPAAVTVLIPPAITSQPLNRSASKGESVRLSVEATGTSPLQYQWFRNGSPIPSATSSELNIVSVTSGDAGVYTVTVVNGAGTATSNPAEISFINAPAITLQPQSQSVVEGDSLTLKVEATGSTPLQYQWFKNSVPIPGATAPTLFLASAQSSDSAQFTVRISNAAGSVTSSPATVTVLVPPAVTSPPLSQSVLKGATLQLSVQVTGSAPLQYQWLRNNTALPGGTGATLQINSIQQSDEGSYSVKISNAAGAVTSAPAIVTVLVAPTITEQPASRIAAPGSSVTFSAQANGSAPLNYQWYRNGTKLQGANASTLLIASIDQNSAGSYTLEVSNSAGTVTSSSATLTLASVPAIITQPISQTVLLGNTLRLSVSATSSTAVQYQWYHNNVAILQATSSSLEIRQVQLADGGTYVVKVSNSTGTATSDQATIRIGGQPTITSQPASQSALLGGSVTLSVEAGGVAPLSYRWFRNGLVVPGAATASLRIARMQASDEGSYTAEVSNGAGAVTSEAAVVTLLTAPSITEHPISQTVALDSALTLTVQSTGSAPLQYQWFKNGSPVAGATESSYRVQRASEGDSGSYMVKVSNPVTTVSSYPASVTVLVAPAITVQPQSQTVATGAPVNLAISASGSSPLSIQWFRNGSAITGATNATLPVVSAQTANTGTYYARVSNALGTAQSDNAIVNVLTPPTITQQPISQTISAGSIFALSISASGSAPLTYKWYRDGILLPSITSASLSVASASAADAGSYKVTVSNPVGSVTSAVAIVSVVSGPSITAQPANFVTAAGGSATFSVSASGSGALSYQWFHDGVAVPSGTASSLVIPSAQASDGGSYSVKISNSAGTVTSAPATLTILTKPAIVTQPGNVTVAEGALLSLTVEVTGTAPLTYQWTRNGIPVANANGSVLKITPVQPSDAGTYQVQVSNAAGSVTSATATVTVLTRPQITSQPLSRVVAPGALLTLSVSATGPGSLQYQWFRNNAPLPGKTGTSLVLPFVQPADAGNYTVAISNQAGTTTSAPATLTVVTPPAITRQPLSQTISANAPLTLGVEVSGTAPFEFQWLRDGTPVPNSNSAQLQIAAASASDAGNYTVTVSNQTGSVTSEPATVTVILPPTITTQPSSQDLNLGSRLSLSVQFTGSAPIQVQWFRNGAAIPNATSATYQVAALQSVDVGTYTVRLSNAAGSVTSAPAVVAVPSPPIITTQPKSQIAAVGDPVTFTVQATGTGSLQYQWFRNGRAIGGATSPTYTFTAATNLAALYNVTVVNSLGAVISADATLTITSNGSAKGTKATAASVVLDPPKNGAVSIAAFGKNSILMRALGNPGQIYQIQAADSLPAQWLPVASVQASDTGLVEYVTNDGAAPRARFFRLLPE